MNSEQARAELVTVDPTQLVVRANVRAVAAPDPELVDSVRVNGVLQPPLTYRDGADLVLLAGHRRTAAAIAAGLDRIDVVVMAGPPDDAQRVSRQVSENTNRAGLDLAEVSQAVAQLELLGLSAGDIARAAGLRRSQVDAAKGLAAATPATRTKVAATPGMTLEQAAALTDFEGDEKSVDALLRAGSEGPVSFAHTLSQLQAARERSRVIAEVADHYQASGYQVFIDREPQGSQPVLELADRNGDRLGGNHHGPSEAHQLCAGRAVIVSSWDPDIQRVREVCTDPKANGHRRAASVHSRGGAGAPERGEVVANNKLWRTATDVRRRHLAAFVAGGKITSEMIRVLHLHLLTTPDQLEVRSAVFDNLTDFSSSGVSVTAGKYSVERVIDEAASSARVAGLLFAAIAATAEKRLEATTWRSPERVGTRYLKMLVEHAGYQLSDIETKAVRLVEPGYEQPAYSPASVRKTVTRAVKPPATQPSKTATAPAATKGRG